jgi:hypothetical protein
MRRGDFLSVRGRVYIVEGLEEGADGWVQVLPPLDVKGVWLEIVPKRRSQTACGSSDSASDQRPRMSPFQDS